VAITRGLPHGAAVVEIVPAVPVELRAAGEVSRRLIPAPEPGIIGLVAGGLLAAILIPFNLRGAAQDARVGATGVQCPGGHKGADVHPHAVVDVRFPT
jgi:hypothetical protein